MLEPIFRCEVCNHWQPRDPDDFEGPNCYWCAHDHDKLDWRNTHRQRLAMAPQMWAAYRKPPNLEDINV